MADEAPEGIEGEGGELRKSQELMQAFADDLPEFISLKDIDGRFLFVNKRFEAWVGLDRDEVIGKTVYDIYSADQASEFDALDREALNNRSVLTREVDLKYPDGDIRTVASTRFPVVSSTGEVVGLGTINYDLSVLKQAEKALHESRELSRAVIENAVDGIVTIDEKGIIQSINAAVERIFGYSGDEIIGRNVSGLMPEPNRSKHDGFLGRYLRTGKARIIGFGREVIGLRKNGAEFPLDLAVSDTIIDGRHVFTGIVRDITELKEAQAALVKKTELVQLLRQTARDANKAKNLAEAMHDAIADICAYNGWPIGHAYVRSPKDPNVLVPSGIWHLNKTRRFATFKKVTEQTSFKSGQGLPGRVMKSGEPAWIIDVTKDPNFPRAKLAKGIGVRAGFACPVLVGREVVAVLEFFAPEAVEPDQNLLDSLIHVGMQLGRVAERERSERELRESEAALAEKTNILETVLESLPEGIVAFDRDLKLLVWNKNFLDIRGFPSELAEEKRDFQEFIQHDARREEFGPGDPEEMVHRQVERAKKFRHHAFERQRPNGRFISVRGGPMPGGGFVSTYSDITERKEAQVKIEAQRDELELLNQQKNKFFSIIAHDLKGPFTTLLGYSSLMSEMIDRLDRKKIVESATAVHTAAERVFKLLENLLEWSRLQMEGTDFKPAPLDLKEIIDANVKLFAPLAVDKKIVLGSNRTQALEVYADANMVDTIVRNLVNNAIKFTIEGGTVTLSARRKGKLAEVEVTDTGVGIPADKMSRLFRLDEKTSTTGTGGETGTGLGLQLCKELVEKQDGRIQVASTEGEGSVFRFTLPLHQQ